MASYNDIFYHALNGNQDELKSAVDTALVAKIRDKLVNKTLDVSSTILQDTEENGNNLDQEE